jgi:hypothetical protein
MSSIIKVDTVQDQDGNNIINENANTITIGASGDTITIPSGATLANNGTATGFFEGIAWQAITTAATLTAVAGKGYPINTTSNTCTVTLPAAASVGDQVQIVDYAGTFATNNITLTSSLNIEGGATVKTLTTNREGVTITYVDVTQGWVATSGVNSGSQALDPPPPYSVDFLVIAGGASGGTTANGGGGGAGGYRTSTQSVNSETAITVTVGDGGASVGAGTDGNSGSNSSISGSGLTTITSAGGGFGAAANPGGPGASGGSGGGDAYVGGSSGGAGNTPSTSPSQGNNGGAGSGSSPPAYGGGGGGGAGAVGQNGTSSKGGDGGAGFSSSITGSAVTRAGGGAGGSNTTQGTGGAGGGGDSSQTDGVAGTVNTGSGGGEGDNNSGAGGKGVVILSLPDANYSGTTTGSPTVATGVSGKTILTFTGSGSYTA